MNTAYRKFFTHAYQNVLDARRQYEAAVKDWYSTGEGYTKGYSFPRCIHGRSLWVDHDIPCGECEYGATDIQVAQSLARDSFHDYNNRLDWLMSMPAGAPDSLRYDVIGFVFAATPQPHSGS